MEIRQGYKYTEEFGYIPNDWEVKKIKDSCPLQRGFDLPINTIKLGYFPVVFSNGIGRFHNKYKVKAPGVVTGRSGSIGSVFYINEDFWPHNTTLWVTKFINCFPLFIYYVFGLLSFEKYKSGSGVPTLNRNDIHEEFLLLPPIQEQEKIAQVLRDMDKLIESTERLLEKKRNLKTAAMQKLLTPQPHWEESKLGKLNVYVLKGIGVSKEDLSLHGEACIHYGELFTFYKEKIKEVQSKTNKKTKLTIYSKKNDVLMPTSDVTPFGLARASCIQQENIILGSDILVLRFKDKIDGIFFSYTVKNNKNKILSLVKGSTVYHLYFSDLKNFTFSFPPIQEQQQIAQILSDMDEEIEALEKELEKYRMIKTGAMQELLTGKTRLV